MKRKKFDRVFFALIIALAALGFFVFVSASLGLVSRPGADFNLVTQKQLAVLLVGFAALAIVSRIDYRFWRKISPAVFIVSLLATLLVFIPGLGFEAGGAKRWLVLGPLSFQPAEFLKLGFILFLATLFSRPRADPSSFSFKEGLVPFVILAALTGAVLIPQPDIDTLAIIFLAGLGMFFVAGARWPQLFLLLILLIAGLGILAYQKPYIKGRIEAFLNPQKEVRGASYQLNQSLIAVGSGGIFGRGFGQSLQKFTYLPEPIGDSIFAVAAEEFGLVGSLILLLLFLFFALRGLKIANQAPNQFARLTVVGIVIMITAGAFTHIASMLGLVPLVGTPLVFVSHGGSALLVALAAAGIVLNVSRHT